MAAASAGQNQRNGKVKSSAGSDLAAQDAILHEEEAQIAEARKHAGVGQLWDDERAALDISLNVLQVFIEFGMLHIAQRRSVLLLVNVVHA